MPMFLLERLQYLLATCNDTSPRHGNAPGDRQGDRLPRDVETRLKTAVETGRMDAPQAAITSGHNCPFGKWLEGPSIAPSTKASEQYAKVAQLHSLFHAQAAKVGALALAGESTKAI